LQIRDTFLSVVSRFITRAHRKLARLKAGLSLHRKRYLGSVDGIIFNSETTANTVFDLKPSPSSMIAYPPTDRFGTVIIS
jgi:hypothetical protein